MQEQVGGAIERYQKKAVYKKAANFIASPLVATERAGDYIYQENILYLIDSVQGLGEFILAPKDVSYFKQQIKPDISK